MNKRLLLILCGAIASGWAQEAESGFELRSALSVAGFHSHEFSEEPRNGGPVAGGFNALLYPTLKLSSRWAFSGAVQVHSRPYFFEEYYTQGYGLKAHLLQAQLSYSRYWGRSSLVIRAGQMVSAFGSFLPRYDPATNPLTSAPPGYGYYYNPVNVQGLAGAQVDATVGRLDFRAQLTNSSPANPRSVFGHDQYGVWTGGAGFTIRQGLRVGGSAFRGPYLDRHHRFFFPGEAAPVQLPASAYGIDVQWASGPWNVFGEVNHFRMPYRKIPTFNQHVGWAEVRRVLRPRWYAALRVGYQRSSAGSPLETYEMVAGYRPSANQVLKFGYVMKRGPAVTGTLENVATVELVTMLRPFAFAWR